MLHMKQGDGALGKGLVFGYGQGSFLHSTGVVVGDRLIVLAREV